MSRKRLTTEEFITRAREVHGHKYDYSLVEYVNWRTPVKIICPIHGVFEQIPNNHLKGRKCLFCAGNQQSNTNEFITRGREVHGGKYGYSLVKYKDSRTKVKIICPIHGMFEQRPYSHLQQKAGCPQCAWEQLSEQRRLSAEEFITRAREVHGDRYDYSLVEYVNNSTPVKIICSEHGVFEQTPGNHTSMKAGCPQCAETGFNPSEPGTLYVLADDKQYPTLIKIGITNDLKQRLRQLQRRTPHLVVKLVSYPFPHGADAYKLEQEVHKVFHELNVRLKGFDGATEWFKYSPAILDYINEKARN